jgi:hypothetical protein
VAISLKAKRLTYACPNVSSRWRHSLQRENLSTYTSRALLHCQCFFVFTYLFDRYDKLIIAVGSSSATHGVPGLRHSFQLKTVGDAQTIRRRIMGDCLTSSCIVCQAYLIECRQFRNGKLTMHLPGRSQASIELCGLRRGTYRCRDRCCEPSAFSFQSIK